MEATFIKSIKLHEFTITDKHLSEAIIECISNEQYKVNAKAKAKKINERDGLHLTVKLIEEELNKTWR